MSDRLDVETPEARETRLAKLFSTQSVPVPPARPDIHAIAPPSELLSRLQAFLPQMQAANEALPAQGSAEREQMDIENIEGDDRVVEMDLGLGVFNAKLKEEGDDRENESSSSPSSSDNDEGNSADEDDDDDDVFNTRKTPSILKLEKEKLTAKASKRKPGIEVLGETETGSKE